MSELTEKDRICDRCYNWAFWCELDGNRRRYCKNNKRKLYIKKAEGDVK